MLKARGQIISNTSGSTYWSNNYQLLLEDQSWNYVFNF